MSKAITTYFLGSDGKMKRGYQVHINDNGKPLCRCRTRIDFNPIATHKWVVEFKEPTCPVCLRIEKRQGVCN